MADATIGALSVIIGGDASALDRMLKGASGSISDWAKTVTGIASGMGLEKAIEGAVTSVVDSIKKALDDIEQLSKMQEVTGESVESLSKLKYASDMSGVSFDQLGKSLASLSAGMSDLAGGKASAGAQAIQSMGLSVQNTNGTMKTATELLSDVADKFSTYKDGANKAALAQSLFGAGGEALIPLLNKGAQGIADFGNEAQKFGLVVDRDAREAVSSFNENLKKLQAIQDGLYIQIAARLAPALEDLSGQYLQAKEASNLMVQAADFVSASVLRVSGQIAYEIQDIKGWALAIGDVSNLIKAFWSGTTTDIFAAMDRLDTHNKQNQESLASLHSTMQKFLEGAADEGWNLIKDSMKEATFNVNAFDDAMKAAFDAMRKEAPAAARDANNALDRFLTNSAKKTAAASAEADSVGKGADVQARLKVEYEATAIALANGIALTDEYRAKIAAAGDAAAAAALKLQGAQVTQASLTPMEQRNQLLLQYTKLLDAGKISTDTFAIASAKVQFPNFTAAALQATDYEGQLDKLATSGVNGLTNAFAQFATGQESASQAFQQFAVQFLTQMIQMVAQAIIFKTIMAALGFSGGGEVGTMQVGDQFFPQFKADGGFISGPGTATSDSIPAMLSNGEFVTNAAAAKKWMPLLVAINQDRIPRFNAGGSVGNISSMSGSLATMAGKPMAQTVVHQFDTSSLPAKTVWRRSEVVDLIDQFNEALRNGKKLAV